MFPDRKENDSHWIPEIGYASTDNLNGEKWYNAYDQ